MMKCETEEYISWTGEHSNGNKWTLYCGDSVEVLKSLPDKSIDCIVTSPPYYSLRDYQVDGQIGLEDTVNDYVQSLCAVMDEAYRVLKDSGTLFLNIGDTYYSGKGKSHGIDAKSAKRRFGLRPVDKSGGVGVGALRKTILGVPWRVAIEMMSRKWILRAPIIWHRGKALPEAVKDRPTHSYEYVYMFVKERFYFFDRAPLKGQQLDEDLWDIDARPKSGGLQTAPFPDELVKRCLEIGCPQGGVVLDPFVGSGTTMRVALENGMDAIGVELNRSFCDYIVNEREL